MGTTNAKIINRLKQHIPQLIVMSLILLFLIVYLAQNIFITVGAGEGSVLWRRFFGGTVTDTVFGEGLHVIFPWDKMTVYNVRIQQVAHDFDVLTKNGLRIHLSISIRYQPEYDLLGVLHQRLGPDYVKTVVIPEIEQVLRVIVGQLDAEQVYTTETKASPIEKALNAGIENVGRKFINIDNVIIKEISLPPKIREAIESKIQQKHLAAAYEFILLKEEKEAQRKKIEAGGIKIYNETIEASLSAAVLKWKGIEATLALSQSNNAKVVVIGSGKDGLPIIGNIPMESFEKLGVPKGGDGAKASPDAGADVVESPPEEGIAGQKSPPPEGSDGVKGSSKATKKADTSDVEK